MAQAGYQVLHSAEGLATRPSAWKTLGLGFVAGVLFTACVLLGVFTFESSSSSPVPPLGYASADGRSFLPGLRDWTKLAGAVPQHAELVVDQATLQQDGKSEAEALDPWAPLGAKWGAFDYYLLVRTWGPTFCDLDPEGNPYVCAQKSIRDAFTLHGLWPNNFDGTYPEYCLPFYKFNEWEVYKLLPELHQEWPSLMAFDDVGFWAHEWDRHGTCTLRALKGEKGYFGTSLTLHGQYDIGAALETSGIVPSTELYNSSSVASAIDEAFGVKAVLHCERGALLEVWLCIDKLTLKAMDCPEPVGQADSDPLSCALQISLPSLTASSKRSAAK